jgi:uncharacterized protein YbjT (DUF2867 family)
MILVTGASGNVGREVLASCRASGLAAVGADRRGERRLDFTDRATWGPALDGATALFLVRPPPVSDVANTLNPFLDLARSRGVAHVVFLSVQGAESRPRIPHHAVERHLQAGPAGWTLLRPGFFAQNLVDAYRRDLLEDGRLYVPAGEGRVAFIDVRDLGALAARVFTNPQDYDRQAWRLTGSKAFTFHEAAELAGAALGRRVTYVPASVPGYLWHLLARRRLAPMQAVVQAYLHFGLRHGDAEQVDPTLGQLLGRPARDLADFTRDVLPGLR